MRAIEEQSGDDTAVAAPVIAPAGSLAALAAAALLAACGGGSDAAAAPGAGGTSGVAGPAGAGVVGGNGLVAPGSSTGASTGAGSATGATPAIPATPSTPATAVTTGYAYPRAASDEEAARFLLQAQFSAADADIAAVRSQGYAPWLAGQMRAPAAQSGFDWLDGRGYSAVNTTTRYYDNSYPGDYMIWNQLMTSPDALRKRAALALSEFFVLSLSGLDMNWRSHAVAAWWDLLAANAFGNYRKLLEDVTLNAAMGYYLNTKGNLKENPATSRSPDENYGREVMQLFTIGLYQLNLDGTEKRDASGNKIETYTPADTTGIARVFTGWDFDQTQNTTTLEPVQNRTIPSTAFTRLPMRLTAANHSVLASSFLGTSIAANTDGVTALRMALDTLFNHPNVGPFFGRQMIQRLVTSNPSPAYVARVAGAFNNNGAGVRGDLAAVFAAVLLDDEARGPAGLVQPGFGKLREPMLRLVQWGRTFGIGSARASWKIGDLSNPATQLGQSPLRPPSVFNFFRPGYVPPSSALSASQSPAPEFQLVNESTVGAYLNYMQGVIRSGIFVNAPDLPNSASNASNGFDISAAYTSELALVLDANALVKRLNLLLCAGQLSAANQALIVNALNATALTTASSDSARRDRVGAAVLLVMAAADYLVQK